MKRGHIRRYHFSNRTVVIMLLLVIVLSTVSVIVYTAGQELSQSSTGNAVSSPIFPSSQEPHGTQGTVSLQIIIPPDPQP